MRKPSRAVELDDIISSQILGNDPDIIAIVMKVHLALEALMLEMISSFRTDAKIYKLSFPKKTELLQKQGVINLNDQQAFDRFNDFRNDFAHIFGHEVTLGDTLSLARDLESKGVDFSDSVGSYTETQAADYYGGMLGVLSEIGWCILFHATWLLRESGGREIA